MSSRDDSRSARGRVVLTTERLILRELSPDDDSFVLELLNEPSFIRNIADRNVRTLEAAQSYTREVPMRSYEEHGFGMYAVSTLVDPTPLGMCGLVKRDTLPDVDIGFAFLERYWGHGYAIESARAVLAHAVGPLGFRRVAGIVSPGNQPSIRILEKLGLKFESMIRLTPEDKEICLYKLEVQGSAGDRE